MAWKKPEENPSPEPAPNAPRPYAPGAAAPPVEPRRVERATATIGPSIFIKGDLSGDEDLVIEGRVEGKIDLKQHNVTIGKNGRVHADVFGNTVIIEGEVDGNLFAQEQAVLRQSGAVRGNITAPRVMLEDGSRFRGSIDMDSKESPKITGGVPAPGSPGPPAPPGQQASQPNPPSSPAVAASSAPGAAPGGNAGRSGAAGS